MSSRQDEKQRRREEREAQEREAQARTARTRRLQIAGGALLALAAIVGIVLAVTSGGSDKNAAASNPKVAVPKPGPQAGNLTQAAKDAGCKLLNPPSEGRQHTDKPVTYKSNPPSSGNHNPTPAQDGIYAPGNEPAKENWVHTLEHGRIIIQYRPGTAKAIRDQLETVGSESFNGTDGYHVVVMENNTKMPYAVAAVAWTHILGCSTMSPKVFDAIRAFRKQYTDKGPELIQ